MNYSKILIALIFILFSTLSAIAANSYEEATQTVVKKEIIKGGPRDVVQTLVDVTVFQPTMTSLTITLKKSNGEVVSVTNTTALLTVISIQGLDAGDYTIHTEDDFNDVQTFSISVD